MAIFAAVVLWLRQKSHCICVTSTQTVHVDWVVSIASVATREGADIPCIYTMTPIVSETTEFSWTDKVMLSLGCRLYLVESVNRFKQRNPLEKYVLAKPDVDRSSTTIVLLNATCEDLINDAKTGRNAECLHLRQKTFRDFVSVHVSPLLGKAHVVDVPPWAASASDFFEQIALAPGQHKRHTPSDPDTTTEHDNDKAIKTLAL
jgi:hypothetical protein